ncbi:MAG: class I SAM-dependent methyltransferase [Gaiellaceae bacterium]
MIPEPRIRRVLERLEQEDAEERRLGLPRSERARQIQPATGRFLFALAVARKGCKVLEIGGSRGYSAIWLASAAAFRGGRVVSLELDPRKVEAWRANIAEAGLDEWTELIEGDAFEVIPNLEESFDICFLDAEKDDYENLFAIARKKIAVGGLIVADNVLSHSETLAAYVKVRQSDPTLVSVTVPLDHGLELSAIVGRPVAASDLSGRGSQVAVPNPSHTDPAPDSGSLPLS